ncbi:MAG: hypothetical protein ACO38W_07940 [Phycisphaerales bacterium]
MRAPTMLAGGVAWLSVRKRVEPASHASSTVPVGPLRCFARISSATPTRSGF